jgi:hypothetical protein
MLSADDVDASAAFVSASEVVLVAADSVSPDPVVVSVQPSARTTAANDMVGPNQACAIDAARSTTHRKWT